MQSGYQLEFTTRPPERFLLTSISDPEARLALDQEIDLLLLKRAIVSVPLHQRQEGFYSPVFLIKKPDGSHRAIINLKDLNQVILYSKFKMETIASTVNLLKKDCFMASLDLQDAYFHIPIEAESQKYLRFAVARGSEVLHFQFRALPFGLSSSPRVFTKLMAEVMAFFHREEILIVPYLDDFLVIGNSANQVSRHLKFFIHNLSLLGWIVNYKKSDLSPGRSKIFLGILLDSQIQASFLPAPKQEILMSQVSSFRSAGLVSIRSIMSLLGLLTSTIPAVRWAQAHSRSLQAFLLSTWDGQQSSLHRRVSVPSAVRKSLDWWSDRENLGRGVSWISRDPIVITTDASQDGWGAHSATRILQGFWSRAQSNVSSNQRELSAVWETLKAWSPLIQGKDVKVLTDNSTAVAYLNKQGGTRSRALCRIAARIFEWAEVNISSLSAVHLKGEENVKADFLSRRPLLKGEWMLNPGIFAQVIQRFGRPCIDLFASGQNHQVKSFFSLNHRDLPQGVDAFSQSWKKGLLYAFPPFSLIPRVLKKVQEDEALVILIAPFWPRRAWFPILLRLSQGDVWLLPEVEDLLLQGPIVHPAVSQLHLAAWKLKGAA